MEGQIMKLKTKNVLFVGLAFFSICMFWQVYDTVIAKMLINTFGLNQFWSGVIMALDNLLALFLLPLFGALSDKTKTKYGKRTPYIAIGTLVAAVLFTVVAVIDSMQQNALSLPTITKTDSCSIFFNGICYETLEMASDARSALAWNFTQQNIWYLIVFIGVLFLVLIAMATYRTPAVSLMPDVTPKPLRSKANAIINLMGSAGGIIALGYLTFLAKDYQPYIWAFIVTAILMIICIVIFLFKVDEPKLVQEMHEESNKFGINEDNILEEKNEKIKMPKDVKKSLIFLLLSVIFWFAAYNAATSKFSVYAQNVLGMNFSLPLMVAQGAAIISYIPIGLIASKVGRKKTIIVGVSLLFLAFLLGCFVNENTTFLMYITMALAGIAWATINVNSYPMVVEMANNKNIGVYTGYYYTASMGAQIITPMLSGLIMDLTNTMRSLFPYCCIFSILAIITMIFVKHGDSKPIPSKSINFED